MIIREKLNAKDEKKIERNVVQIVSTYMAIKSAFDNQLMLIRDLKSPCVRMHTDFLFHFLSITLITPQTMVISHTDLFLAGV